MSIDIFERTSQPQGHCSPTRHDLNPTATTPSHRQPRSEAISPMPPRVVRPHRDLRPGLRPKPVKPAASSVLHTLLRHSTRVTAVLDRPARQVLLSLARLASTVLTWSTRSLPCTLALVDVPDVSHYSWSPGLLVHQSKPHVRPSPLQVHQHGTSLLDLHLAVDHRLRAPQLNTTSQETCLTHSFRHGNVSHQLNLFVDHVDNHSSQNVPQGYFSTLCSQICTQFNCRKNKFKSPIMKQEKLKRKS